MQIFLMSLPSGGLVSACLPGCLEQEGRGAADLLLVD